MYNKQLITIKMLKSIIAEYFKTFFKNDYIISLNGKNISCLSVRDGHVGYSIDKENWTFIDEDDIIAVNTTTKELKILTNFDEEFRFIARQKTNEEKVNELVEIITDILAGREELDMIKEYLDELKKVNKACGTN